MVLIGILMNVDERWWLPLTSGWQGHDGVCTKWFHKPQGLKVHLPENLRCYRGVTDAQQKALFPKFRRRMIPDARWKYRCGAKTREIALGWPLWIEVKFSVLSTRRKKKWGSMCSTPPRLPLPLDVPSCLSACLQQGKHKEILIKTDVFSLS